MKFISRLVILPIVLAMGASVAQPFSSRFQDDLASRKFQGKFRGGCKTVMLNLPTESFSSVTDLRAKLLVPDAKMRSKYSDIRKPTTERKSEEQHLVSVTANLFAFKFEDGNAPATGDNDFHVILGDDKTKAETLLNIEVSGLPQTGDPGSKFKTIRQQFLNILAQNNLKAKDAFQKFKIPVKVRITGSLYFDADHAAGQVGPAGLRPTTIWEIHPVQKIEVL